MRQRRLVRRSARRWGCCGVAAGVGEMTEYPTIAELDDCLGGLMLDEPSRALRYRLEVMAAIEWLVMENRRLLELAGEDK